MNKKISALICFLFATGLVFQSCDEEDDTPQIGISLKNISNDWHKAAKYYAENNLSRQRLTYTFTGIDTDQTQADVINSMVVSKGCKVLIISSDSLKSAEIDKVISNGASVIFLEEAVGNSYTAVVKTDNATAGKNAAAFLNGIVTDTDSIAILDMSEYDMEVSYARVTGFESAIKDPSRVKYALGANYTSASGKSIAAAILANHPGVGAIYAQDDEVALGILEAIDEETDEDKKKQIKVIAGCGGNQMFLNQMIERKDEITLATTSYTPKMMEKCAELAADIIRGNEVTRENLFEAELIDINNVNGYLDLYLPY